MREGGMGPDAFFFTHRGGRNTTGALAEALEGYARVADDHPYWSDPSPQAMLIAVVEAFWSANADRDDWQPLEDNPWVFVPLRAAREVIGAAEGEVSPDAPGPFAFARAERVRGTLSAAGYRDIEIAPLRAPVCIAEGGIDAGLDFTLRVGPVARLVAEEPEPVRLAVRERIREHLAPLVREGRIELEGAVWVVSARAGS